MLRELTWEQLLEWMEYDRISPIGDRRGDWHAASICAAVVNAIAGQGGSKKRVRVSDMLLNFSPDQQQPAPATKEEPRRQTEAEMKFIARMSVALSRADENKKKRR